ncbi:PIG-L family deacetylase [Shinella sp. AETb1-6]|jgi:LmbE family N-acetylglucosaminyl deacetylase|uniref:PIG-L deacetylase family protein n=1 Tax=Shinella sp. AETb1-6 TaxID=2692210 RepID=UPI001370556B|nr:PIG-L deacetylase family protein [Shinella sp. AETb1-6]MXN50867.1 PIG-L family deacetylase [Shinella sp. AETb1-6]
MKMLPLASAGHRLRVLCLGAHADDIEIGAGGTILGLIAAGVELEVFWCVMSATPERATETRLAAAAFLEGAASAMVEVCGFEDSYFPSQSREIKTFMLSLRDKVEPDVIFTHSRHDAHQDHRELNKLTMNIFRDHFVLEYEIPKWDGDITQRNAYVPLQPGVIDRKIDLLMAHFATQRSKDWFDADVFRGLARMRGMECRSPSLFAEAFTIRKMALA